MNPWFTMYPYLVLHNAGTDRAFCFSICLNQRELGPLAVSHQVPVHFPGGFAALPNGPHHQGLSPAHVPGGEHAGDVGGIAPLRCLYSGAGSARQSEGLRHIVLGAQEADSDKQQLAGQQFLRSCQRLAVRPQQDGLHPGEVPLRIPKQV